VKLVSKIVARGIIHLLIVAQLILIFNDFPSTENTSKAAIKAKAAKVKFVFTESELLDGEEDNIDFYPQDLIIHGSNRLHLIFGSPSLIQHLTSNDIFFVHQDIFLVNRSLLI